MKDVLSSGTSQAKGALTLLRRCVQEEKLRCAPPGELKRPRLLDFRPFVMSLYNT